MCTVYYTVRSGSYLSQVFKSRLFILTLLVLQGLETLLPIQIHLVQSLQQTVHNSGSKRDDDVYVQFLRLTSMNIFKALRKNKPCSLSSVKVDSNDAEILVTENRGNPFFNMLIAVTVYM